MRAAARAQSESLLELRERHFFKQHVPRRLRGVKFDYLLDGHELERLDLPDKILLASLILRDHLLPLALDLLALHPYLVSPHRGFLE